MAAKKKPRKILRGLPGSTEAAARRVVKKHLTPKKKPKPTKDTGGKTTAKSVFSKTKTKAKAAASKAAVKKRIAAKVAAAKAKSKKFRKSAVRKK